jgi:hypothetical protein
VVLPGRWIGLVEVCVSDPFTGAEGWDAIVLEQTANEDALRTAVDDERSRCLLIVRRELEEGKARGIPSTSGIMIVLERIARSIEG